MVGPRWGGNPAPPTPRVREGNRLRILSAWGGGKKPSPLSPSAGHLSSPRPHPSLPASSKIHQPHRERGLPWQQRGGVRDAAMGMLLTSRATHAGMWYPLAALGGGQSVCFGALGAGRGGETLPKPGGGIPGHPTARQQDGEFLGSREAWREAAGGRLPAYLPGPPSDHPPAGPAAAAPAAQEPRARPTVYPSPSSIERASAQRPELTPAAGLLLGWGRQTSRPRGSTPAAAPRPPRPSPAPGGDRSSSSSRLSR